MRAAYSAKLSRPRKGTGILTVHYSFAEESSAGAGRSKVNGARNSWP
jgi:hypothetical protein